MAAVKLIVQHKMLDGAPAVSGNHSGLTWEDLVGAVWSATRQPASRPRPQRERNRRVSGVQEHRLEGREQLPAGEDGALLPSAVRASRSLRSLQAHVLREPNPFAGCVGTVDPSDLRSEAEDARSVHPSRQEARSLSLLLGTVLHRRSCRGMRSGCRRRLRARPVLQGANG